MSRQQGDTHRTGSTQGRGTTSQKEENTRPHILPIGPQPDSRQSDTNVIGDNKLMMAEQVLS